MYVQSVFATFTKNFILSTIFKMRHTHMYVHTMCNHAFNVPIEIVRRSHCPPHRRMENRISKGAGLSTIDSSSVWQSPVTLGGAKPHNGYRRWPTIQFRMYKIIERLRWFYYSFFFSLCRLVLTTRVRVPLPCEKCTCKLHICAASSRPSIYHTVNVCSFGMFSTRRVIKY